MNEFLMDTIARWTSRKVVGAVIVTAAMLYNAWAVAGRPLDWQEIVAIGTVWGAFITAEGIADIESRKIASKDGQQAGEVS